MKRTSDLEVVTTAAQHTALLPSAFVRLPTILKLIPVSRSTLWEMVARGDFPKPVKLSSRVTAWRSDDVLAFIASRQRCGGQS